MADTDSRNYEHSYEPSFEDSLKGLGLTGNNFRYFWRQVEANLDFDPFNVYSREVPGTDGFWIYPTEEAHLDIPALYVIFSVERDKPKGRIHYFGLEKPVDWLFPPAP